jgi:hypothetical protein
MIRENVRIRETTHSDIRAQAEIPAGPALLEAAAAVSHRSMLM